MSKEPAAAERVLVIKPSSFGDVIHTLPAVSALKKTFPHWNIHWLANEEWAPLLNGNPDLEEVIRFPRKSFHGLGGLLKARRWAKKNLAPRKFDRVLDFQGLLRSAMLAKACGANQVVGFAQARETAPLWYDDTVNLSDWELLHAVDRYLALAKALGADISNIETHAFHLTEGISAEAVPTDQTLIALHPFSRGIGKSLTSLEVVEFCQAVKKFSPEKRIVLLGSDTLDDINLPENTINQLGQTSIAQLIWILRQADVVVSVDSGPMHLAAAITDRLISIHTWTDPAKVGPWQKQAWFWRDGQLLRIGDIKAGQLPERRKSRRLIEQVRRQTNRLLPEGTMAHLAQAVVGPDGVFDDS
ncbi:MAG: glycosyltransferase family 9 protein [Verrucomicrobia bacterium]|nr:glycosyltransferase family 9 protein [Verrucomicrobiota bacterium]